MEEDIIDRLYFGRIVPWERQVGKPPEIEKCSDQVCEDVEYLQKRLDEVGKSVLERLLDNQLRGGALSAQREFQIWIPTWDAACGSRLGQQRPAVKYTNYPAKDCAGYPSELACYYRPSERICVLPKGKTHKTKRRILR